MTVEFKTADKYQIECSSYELAMIKIGFQFAYREYEDLPNHAARMLKMIRQIEDIEHLPVSLRFEP